jgi:hypothetical protein
MSEIIFFACEFFFIQFSKELKIAGSLVFPGFVLYADSPKQSALVILLPDDRTGRAHYLTFFFLDEHCSYFDPSFHHEPSKNLAFSGGNAFPNRVGTTNMFNHSPVIEPVHVSSVHSPSSFIWG